jgi:hypothetical protein
LDVWIGAFDEQTALWNREGPKERGTVLSDFLPPCHGRHFYAIIDRIRDGTYEGRQLDWGSLGAKVSKQQVAEFVAEIYDADPIYLPGTQFPWLLERLIQIRRFIADLDPERLYILVATEI